MIEIIFTRQYPVQSSDFTIDNQVYTARIKWNQRFSFWSLSLYDRESGLIAGGIRMVANSPLIGFLNLSEFDGDFLFIRNCGEKAEPDFHSTGDDFSLIYLTRSEIDEFISKGG